MYFLCFLNKFYQLFMSLMIFYFMMYEAYCGFNWIPFCNWNLKKKKISRQLNLRGCWNLSFQLKKFQVPYFFPFKFQSKTSRLLFYILMYFLLCTSYAMLAVCVHGTYKEYMESILELGLKRMKRLHVHFSSGLPTDGEVISGKRFWEISFQ